MAQQPAPAFEVASVKPTLGSPGNSTWGLLPSGRFVATNSLLRDVIFNAHGVTPDRLLGGPDWIGSVFRVPGFRHTADRYGQRMAEWDSPRLSLTINRVCKTCNTGWMSDLETETKPVLKPLIRGKDRTLWTDHQTLLTAWLVKTSMVMEFTSDAEREPYYTPENRRARIGQV
jgi:hypothetical protein